LDRKRKESSLAGKTTFDPKLWPAVGLVWGAGLGTAVAIAFGAVTYLALGGAVGAALGLILGAMARTHRTSRLG
jgi:hypothetical protein